MSDLSDSGRVVVQKNEVTQPLGPRYPGLYTTIKLRGGEVYPHGGCQ